MKLEFSRQVFERKKKKKAQISSSIKIHPVGAELFHADRHTDMAMPILAFRNSVNAAKSYSFTCTFVWVSNLASRIKGSIRTAVTLIGGI